MFCITYEKHFRHRIQTQDSYSLISDFSMPLTSATLSFECASCRKTILLDYMPSVIFLYFVQSEKKGAWFNNFFVFIFSMLLSFWALCTWHCSDVTFFQIIASYLNHGLIFWRISVFCSIQVDPWYLQIMTMITRGFCHREMLCSYTNNYVSKCSYIFIPM